MAELMARRRVFRVDLGPSQPVDKQSVYTQSIKLIEYRRLPQVESSHLFQAISLFCSPERVIHLSGLGYVIRVATIISISITLLAFPFSQI